MTALLQLGVAAVVTVVVGLLSDQGWPGYLVGAILALALWVMLFAGARGRGADSLVDTGSFALAAGLAVVLGYVLFRVGGDDNAAWWAPGFILAGVLTPVARAAAARDDR